MVLVFKDDEGKHPEILTDLLPKPFTLEFDLFKMTNHISPFQDRDLTGAALRELTNHGLKFRLQKFEIPGAVCLANDVWDPDSGLVTKS